MSYKPFCDDCGQEIAKKNGGDDCTVIRHENRKVTINVFFNLDGAKNCEMPMICLRCCLRTIGEATKDEVAKWAAEEVL